MSPGLCKTNKLFIYKSYFIYRYIQDLALDNLEELICHKMQLINILKVTEEFQGRVCDNTDTIEKILDKPDTI